MTSLFSPLQLGHLQLNNRVAMAPMTRARIQNVQDAADENTAIYYRQRASAGLLITEGSPISRQGQGFLYIPGIYNQAQVKGWQQTTKAVHAQGGKIFIQLWHVGGMSHTCLQPDNQLPVSSVDTQANGTCFAFDENGEAGRVQVSEARGLSGDEIKDIIADYVQAAKNAVEAGFDGVEIHAANGYLIEQFINAGVNTRTDSYGAQTVENRLRFALEVTDAVCEAIGSERTGIRISPFGRFSDMPAFDDEELTWLTLGEELSKRNLAYVHVNNQDVPDGSTTLPQGFIEKFRSAYQGVLMIAGVGLWLAIPVALFIGTVGGVSVFYAVYIQKRELICACVGGDSNVPLGFISLTENLFMIGMGLWMLVKMTG